MKWYKKLKLWYNVRFSNTIYKRDTFLDNTFEKIFAYSDLKPNAIVYEDYDIYHIFLEYYDYIIVFWNVNHWYAWMSEGIIYKKYAKNKTEVLYRWKNKMPSKKWLYRFALAIEEYKEEKMTEMTNTKETKPLSLFDKPSNKEKPILKSVTTKEDSLKSTFGKFLSSKRQDLT